MARAHRPHNSEKRFCASSSILLLASAQMLFTLSFASLNAVYELHACPAPQWHDAAIVGAKPCSASKAWIS